MVKKQRRRLVLIIIMLLLCICYGGLYVMIVAKANLTENNTMEYALTILDIRERNNNGKTEIVIISEEFGCSWIINAPVSGDIVNTLSSGDQVFVRIDESSEANVDSTLFVIVVSLRSADTTYLTLEAYNEYMYQKLQPLRNTGFIAVLGFLTAALILVIRFRSAKKKAQLLPHKNDEAEGGCVNPNEK